MTISEQLLYTHNIQIYKYKQKHNINNSMNERTHFFIKKNISLTLYSRNGLCWLCVRGELETGTHCYILTQLLLTIAALLSHLGWGCSNVGHWGPKALCLLLALTSATCPRLTLAVSVLVILLFNIHLLPLFFRLFIQVHLLIDGLVEGQYVTQRALYTLIRVCEAKTS